MNLSDRQRKLVFAALVVVLTAVGVYLTVTTPDEGTAGSEASGNSTPAPVPATTAAAPSVSPPGIGSKVTPENFDIYRLLPFPRRDFATAADLAQRFTAAYGTYSYDEDPQAYVARLEPMSTDELATEIARGSSAPGIQEERRAAQTVAEGKATLDSVRSIEDNSIIFLVTGIQQVTKNGKTAEERKQFAVTVARDGSALRVYAIEPANAAQEGDTG
jgi:hypothetical protein